MTKPERWSRPWLVETFGKYLSGVGVWDGPHAFNAQVEDVLRRVAAEAMEEAAKIVEPLHPMPETVPARAHYMALKTAAGYIRERAREIANC